jgi:hypothetical protein
MKFEDAIVALPISNINTPKKKYKFFKRIWFNVKYTLLYQGNVLSINIIQLN